MRCYAGEQHMRDAIILNPTFVCMCVCVRCCQGDGQMAGSMNVFARVSRLRLIGIGTFTLERKSSFKGSNMWRKPQTQDALHITAAQHLHPVNVYHRAILSGQSFDRKHITSRVICSAVHSIKHDVLWAEICAERVGRWIDAGSHLYPVGDVQPQFVCRN